jgi:hypothetical protein
VEFENGMTVRAKATISVLDASNTISGDVSDTGRITSVDIVENLIYILYDDGRLVSGDFASNDITINYQERKFQRDPLQSDRTKLVFIGNGVLLPPTPLGLVELAFSYFPETGSRGASLPVTGRGFEIENGKTVITLDDISSIGYGTYTLKAESIEKQALGGLKFNIDLGTTSSSQYGPKIYADYKVEGRSVDVWARAAEGDIDSTAVENLVNVPVTFTLEADAPGATPRTSQPILTNTNGYAFSTFTGLSNGWYTLTASTTDTRFAVPDTKRIHIVDGGNHSAGDSGGGGCDAGFGALALLAAAGAAAVRVRFRA